MQSGLREEEEEADTDVDLLTNIKKNSGPTLIGLDLENHVTKEIVLEIPPNLCPESGNPKSHAQRSKEYYERLKANEELYRARLDKQKLRSRINRAIFREQATEEEKENRRRKNRERLQRWRQRKAQNAESERTFEKAKPLTQQDIEKLKQKREREKERRKAARAAWSTQRRITERKKAMDRYYRRKSKNPSKKSRAQATLKEDKALPTRKFFLAVVIASLPGRKVRSYCI